MSNQQFTQSNSWQCDHTGRSSVYIVLIMRIYILSVPNLTGFAHYWLTIYIFIFYRIKTTCKDSKLPAFALVEERDGVFCYLTFLFLERTYLYCRTRKLIAIMQQSFWSSRPPPRAARTHVHRPRHELQRCAQRRKRDIWRAFTHRGKAQRRRAACNTNDRRANKLSPDWKILFLIYSMKL